MLTLYEVGDIVQLNSAWNNLCAIVVESSKEHDGEMAFPLYRLVIQTHQAPVWLSEAAIVRKINR